MGIGKDDIHKFRDPVHWVRYFPPIGREHLKAFGTHIDEARSFITTELNPYYNSFIEWQFNLLKAKGYIKFGNRPSIYSPLDKQMCADHDRAEGEGVVP
jgi:leucyl-tRNA synthetase